MARSPRASAPHHESMTPGDHTARSHDKGMQDCQQARQRGHVVISGRIRSVLVQPRSGAPSLEAELYDETGAVRLIWLGRRTIPGVEPGRSMIAEGFANQGESVPTIFNPRFELLTMPGEGR